MVNFHYFSLFFILFHYFIIFHYFSCVAIYIVYCHICITSLNMLPLVYFSHLTLKMSECKVQWVCVDQRIALYVYKSDLLFFIVTEYLVCVCLSVWPVSWILWTVQDPKCERPDRGLWQQSSRQETSELLVPVTGVFSLPSTILSLMGMFFLALCVFVSVYICSVFWSSNLNIMPQN